MEFNEEIRLAFEGIGAVMQIQGGLLNALISALHDRKLLPADEMSRRVNLEHIEDLNRKVLDCAAKLKLSHFHNLFEGFQGQTQ